jgi:hypothetical protein
MALTHISDATLATRYVRVCEARLADKSRMQPNPNGDGYLTREERWNEVIHRIGHELVDRCCGSASSAAARSNAIICQIQKKNTMTADQLLAELQTVAPRDIDDWMDLRRAHIEALPLDDSERVGRVVSRLSMINAR